MSEPDKPLDKSRRGGARKGAGRKKKGHTAPSAIAGLNLVSALATPPPDEIDGVAQRHAKMAIEALVKQLIHGASEAAKVGAAKAILDRGYGKPAVEIGGDAAAQLPFMAAPTTQFTSTADIRAEARKYANLAIEVLRKIADDGVSEAAKVSAATAILERGLGTVGKARMPDEMRDRPLGKKEEAARAAEASATGRYATPAPPKAFAETVQ
jgi:hypothetical protein